MTESSAQLRLFRVGGATCGLDSGSIQAVTDTLPIYRVPQAGAFLLGVINLHGQVLPVIDLPGLLGLDGSTADQRLVVLSPEYHSLALAVSEVGGMVAYDSAALRPPTAAEQAGAVVGVVEGGALHEGINLLDAGVLIERLKILYAI